MSDKKKKFSVEQLSSLYEELSGDAFDDEETLTEEFEFRYEKIKPIAVGSFKKVWKVFDRKTERHLALAELLKPDKEGAKERFIREAKLTALLDHPNIISVYDIGINEDDNPFFVMELKDGLSLHEMLFKKNQTSLSDDIDLELQTFLKICDALNYAHSNGILHLDIKPANIQVGEHGETRVGDWGMGQLTPSKIDFSEHREIDPDLMTPLTLSKHIRGTPGYMAPEQTKVGYKPDHRSDIFSLGILLAVILTKQPPIEGDGTVLIENTQAGKFIYTHPLASGSALPSGLKAIIQKAMAIEKEDRYQTVSELQADLRLYMKGYPTLAEGQGWFIDLRHLYKRNRSVSLTALAGLLVLSLVSAFYIIRLKVSEQLAHQSRKDTELALEVSNAERSRAEQLQMLYLREKQFAENVVSKTYHLNFEILQKSTQPNLFDDPVTAFKNAEDRLDEKLNENPNHAGYNQQKGLLAFIKQDFNRAYFDLSAFQHGIEDLLSVSAIFKQRYSQKEKGLLPLNGMLELIELMVQRQDRMPILMMLLAYDSKFRDPWDHAQLVKSLIKFANPEWDAFFAYDAKRNHLTLRGDHLNSLSLGFQPLLKTLKIKSLDIKSSNFRELSQIKGLKLNQLDLRETKALSIKPLLDADICKRVIITPEQFNRREIEQVSKQISILEKEKELTPKNSVDEKHYLVKTRGRKNHYILHDEFSHHALYWPIKTRFQSEFTLHAIIKPSQSKLNGFELELNGIKKRFFPDDKLSSNEEQLIKVGLFKLPKGNFNLNLKPIIGDEKVSPSLFAKFWIEEHQGFLEREKHLEGLLMAQDAGIQGDFARFLSTADRRCIGVWHGTSTILNWPIKVLKPGKLKIQALMAIPEEHIGGQVKVELNDSNFVFEVPSTPNWGEFRIIDLGEIDVKEFGNANLKFTPLKAGAQNVVLDVHSIIFGGDAKVIYDDKKTKILQSFDVLRK